MVFNGINFKMPKDTELEYIIPMVIRISEKIRGLYTNPAVFEAKLSKLTVKIETNSILTQGEVSVEPITGSIRLTLSVYPMNSKKFLAFIIGHEFAHIIFSNPNDPLSISGLARDGSTNYSAVERVSDGKTYGLYMEEIFADYIASMVIANLGYEDENRFYEKYHEQTIGRHRIAKEFEKWYGKSIYKTRKLNAFEDEKFNFLWTSISAYSFNGIIDRFNKKRYKNAYKDLCSFVEQYWKFSSDEALERAISLIG